MPTLVYDGHKVVLTTHARRHPVYYGRWKSGASLEQQQRWRLICSDLIWCKAMSMVCIWYGHKVALTKYYLTTHARRHLVYYGRCSLEQQQQRRRLLCSHLMRVEAPVDGGGAA